MEVGQGQNWGCRAKGKKLHSMDEHFKRSVQTLRKIRDISIGTATGYKMDG
jgi:hypothetical protein